MSVSPADQGRLGAEALAAGHELIWRDRVSSTNDIALEAARAGQGAPLWVIAREQTAGRGRNGRHWHSSPGNFYATVMLPGICPIAVAPQIGFVAAIAVAEALEALRPELPALGLEARAGAPALKWPNDVLLDGAKLCGILAESLQAPDRGGRFCVAVGMGVNLSRAPADMPYAVASWLAGRVDPNSAACDAALAAFARLLSDRFVARLHLWNAGLGFPAIAELWRARAVGLGGRARVQRGSLTLEGVLIDLDDCGRLIMDCPQGRQLVDAGEVFLLQAGSAGS